MPPLPAPCPLPSPLVRLQPCPSHANFVLCRVAEGRDAKALKDALAKEHAIMVRHYRCMRCAALRGRQRLLAWVCSPELLQGRGARRARQSHCGHGSRAGPCTRPTHSRTHPPRPSLAHRSTKELNNFIRISVGLPEHTEKLLAALRGMA